jgi:Mn-containing catalase
VFAPDYAPEEIAEIARRLRDAAGLSDEPTGVVANDADGVMSKVRDAIT